MAQYADQNDPIEQGIAVTDSRAQKRVAIGLSPQRPTAKSTVARPPSHESIVGTLAVWLALALLALLLATGLLAVARLAGAPTDWPTVRATLAGWLTAETAGTPDDLADGYRLLIASDFDRAPAVLAAADLPGHSVIGQVTDAGLYRMRVWPESLAWSTLGRICLAPYRLDAQATVAEAAPDGYVAMLGRFQDERNFYLFSVDGAGRYQVSVQLDGVWRVLQPWTADDAILTAGQANVLRLEDDGFRQLFFVNDAPLLQVNAAQLPAGNTGIAGGGLGAIVELDVNWLRFYDLPCRVEGDSLQ